VKYHGKPFLSIDIYLKNEGPEYKIGPVRGRVLVEERVNGEREGG
jgi:hypothetical protein